MTWLENSTNTNSFPYSSDCGERTADGRYVRLNPQGLVAETRDARGRVNRYDYESDNSLIAIHSTDGSSIVRHGSSWVEYKSGVRLHGVRASAVVAADGDVGWTDYNGLIQVEHLDGSITKIFSDHSQITLDQFDRVQSTTSVAGTILYYEYDVSGLLTTVRLDCGHTMRREPGAWVEYRQDRRIREVACDLAVTVNGDLVWIAEDRSATILHLNDSTTNLDPGAVSDSSVLSVIPMQSHRNFAV